MPFTVSHIAAVLPLRRRCSTDEFAALAIGSVMPDMPYFLPVLREHWPLPSHQLISLPLFWLPVGGLLWLLWRPLWTSAASADKRAPPLPALWRVMLALTVGALTHLAWDAFTHAHFGLGLYLPVMGQPVFWIGQAGISSANLLQYGSSVAGLLLLAAAAWPARRQLADSLRAGVPMGWFAAWLLTAAALASSLTFAFTWNRGGSASQLHHAIRLTAWNGLSSSLLIVVSYPLIWRLRQRRTTTPEDAKHGES